MHVYLRRAMRKRPFGHMRTAKAQISMRLFAHAYQGLRCPQNEWLDSTEYFNGDQMPGWDFAHVQDDVNPHIMHMLEGTFSFDAAHL